MQPNGSNTVKPNDLIQMHRLMLLSRRFTESVLSWYKEGRIHQGLHPSIGQEAVGVGACYGLLPGDWVLPSLRTTEAFWARGVTVLQQLNTMLGNSGSSSSGKESSHHAGYPERGILAGTGIVGSAIPVAAGAALALQMQGSEGVMLCFFGDGAANRGDFHEGLNLAAVLKVPAVFICENNGYVQTVSLSSTTLVTDIANRAASYGIPGQIVDGQDVLAVHEATKVAISRARKGQGPTLLECKTYRFKPHYPIFNEDRPRDEIDRWLKRDPLTISADRLKTLGYADDRALESMDREILEELEASIRQAESTSQPDPQEVFDHIYSEPTEEMGL
jgi:TPP-dependent pyruvate/acetoin dehydrogenase alpha subunit